MAYRWLTELVEWFKQDPVLRDRIVEVPGWQTRGRPPSSFIFEPRWLITHHTAHSTSCSPATSLRVLRDGNSSVPGPISQLFISREPKLYVIAAGRANHAGAGTYPDGASGNGYSLGIEFDLNGIGEPTDDFRADFYARTAAAVLHGFGWSVERMLEHHTYAPTRKIDPAGPVIFQPQGGTWSLGAWREFVKVRQVQYLPPAPQPVPVPPPAPPAPEPDGISHVERSYTVVAGDSPWRVAEKVYGKGSLYTVIQEFNPGPMTVGQLLRVPFAVPYVAVAGDSPWRIAEKCYRDGRLYTLITRANSGRPIVVGETYCIPPKP